MEHLNYHHLRVFWTAAREGGVTRASEKLHVSQPTVTTQIRALERALGHKLFARSGRRLVLTDSGRSAYRYADEIVGLGQELVDRMKGGSPGRELRLIVGIADVLPKLIAYRILEPALKLPEPVRVGGASRTRPSASWRSSRCSASTSCSPTRPSGPHGSASARTTICSASARSRCSARAGSPGPTSRGFPRSLDGAPFLLPRQQSALRLALDDWFAREGVRPHVVGEFDDSCPHERCSDRRGSACVPRAFTHRAPRCVASYGVRCPGRRSNPSARGSTPSQLTASSSTRPSSPSAKPRGESSSSEGRRREQQVFEEERRELGSPGRVPPFDRAPALVAAPCVRSSRAPSRLPRRAPQQQQANSRSAGVRFQRSN